MLQRAGRWTSVLALVVLSACDHYAAEGPPQLAPAAGSTSSPGYPSTSVPTTPVEPVTMPPCAPVGTPPSAVVEPIRLETGCAPPGEVIVYRCGPDLDPIVALGLAGQPSRFVGGRFALPVAILPEGAVDLGVTSAGRIWSVPGDPGAIVLEDSTGLERWLALPSRRTAPQPPTATVIGDSLLDGAQDELVAALPAWELTIDAEVGRSTFGAATIAESWVQPPTVLVVQLAVNDHDPAAASSNLTRIAEAAGRPLLLLWLTGHGPGSDTDDVNRAIVDGLAQIPRGTVADWDRLVPSDALDPDGVHLLGDRQGELATVIADRLKAWQAMVTGEGGTACEGVIRAAIRRTGE